MVNCFDKMELIAVMGILGVGDEMTALTVKLPIKRLTTLVCVAEKLYFCKVVRACLHVTLATEGATVTMNGRRRKGLPQQAGRYHETLHVWY